MEYSRRFRFLVCALGFNESDLEGVRLQHTATATYALLRAAIQPSAPIAVTVGPQIEGLELACVKRLIGRNLGAARLGPSHLCTMAGIFRSRLYQELTRHPPA